MADKKHVYVALYRLMTCCNTIGVFSSVRTAVLHVTRNAVIEMVAASPMDYGDDVYERHVEIIAHLPQLEFVVSPRSTGQVIRIDLRRRGRQQVVEAGVFVITRHLVDCRHEGMDDKTNDIVPGDGTIPFVHAPPRGMQ